MRNVVIAVVAAAATLAASASAHAAPPSDPFGPFGYRTMRLGMSEKDALATGMVETYETGLGQSHCDEFPWKGMPAAVGGISVSPQHGVVLISALPGQLTPEGIGDGSTRAAATAAYPAVHQAANGRMEAVVPGNPHAVYSFDITHDTVQGLGLWSEYVDDCSTTTS